MEEWKIVILYPDNTYEIRNVDAVPDDQAMEIIGTEFLYLANPDPRKSIRQAMGDDAAERLVVAVGIDNMSHDDWKWNPTAAWLLNTEMQAGNAVVFLSHEFRPGKWIVDGIPEKELNNLKKVLSMIGCRQCVVYDKHALNAEYGKAVDK